MSRFWRLYQYQLERFPLATTALLVGALTFASLNYSQSARRQLGEMVVDTNWLLAVAAFFCVLGFFFQLRVADEFKDYPEDVAHRPYRPAPRGLVTLSELAAAAVIVAAAQALITWLLTLALLGPLLLVWAYMGLMRVEFFAPAWLKAHPTVYLLSHMVILPLIVFFITAHDWLVARSAPPPGLVWPLGLSFANGLVFELGRKIRSPHEEEPGVETYSALWGAQRASAIWLAVVTVAAMTTGVALWQIDAIRVWNIGLLGLLWCGALFVVWRFGDGHGQTTGKTIERFAAATVLLSYTVLAVGAFVG
jgi:4-hydroxybenzoate polyprenyltransferase